MGKCVKFEFYFFNVYDLYSVHYLRIDLNRRNVCMYECLYVFCVGKSYESSYFKIRGLLKK